MGTTLAVARREFRSFFNSPVAYIVLGGFLLTAGWLYFSTLFVAGQASLRGFFGVAPVLFVVFAPAVTMRLIAEERKSGTLELLLTLPLNDWQVVTGKFLAALGMVGVGLLLTLPYPLSVAALTAPGASFDWGPVVMGYVGRCCSPRASWPSGCGRARSAATRSSASSSAWCSASPSTSSTSSPWCCRRRSRKSCSTSRWTTTSTTSRGACSTPAMSSST
ncbi:ABC transporter permease [Cystobacter fuscus]